jgi:hypothetical protein
MWSFGRTPALVKDTKTDRITVCPKQCCYLEERFLAKVAYIYHEKYPISRYLHSVIVTGV